MTCTMITMFVYIIIGSSNPFIVYEFMTIVYVYYMIVGPIYIKLLIIVHLLCYLLYIHPVSNTRVYDECNIWFYDFYLKTICTNVPIADAWHMIGIIYTMVLVVQLPFQMCKCYMKTFIIYIVISAPIII